MRILGRLSTASCRNPRRRGSVLAVSLIVVMVIVSLFKSGRSGWGWVLIVGIGIAIFFILRAAASSGGSGGSFGGGSSGGGGASGSW